MKQLILVRHAKSSWKDADLDDHDRPLNKRGERDAPFMGKILKEKNVKPDLIASSSAVRAIQTAEEFAKKLEYKKNKILQADELYLADSEGFTDYVKNISDEHQTVMLFGHNPGITLFANYLSNEEIGNIPTSGVYALTFDISSWNEIEGGTARVNYFLFPKMYFKDAED